MDENKDVQQTEQQEKQPAPLSEARKTALLRYMAVLFAVAFLLVLLSLILQAHSSKATISELTQTSSSALSNVEQLQAQNRDLQDEKQTLTQEGAGRRSAKAARRDEAGRRKRGERGKAEARAGAGAHEGSL